jgi:diguanylate cyclase (GGDEF)-like protein
MKNFCHKLNQSLQTHLQSFTYKERVYYIFLSIGLVSACLSFISGLIADLNQYGLYACLFCSVYILIIFIDSLITHNFKRNSLFLCIGFNFFIFPLNYIYSGGNDGGMPIYFLMGIFGINLLLTGRLCLIMSLLSMMGYISLIFYSYFHPDIILPYTNKFSATIDMTFGLVSVSLLIGTAVSSLMHQYEIEHKKSNSLNRQLHEFAIKDPLTNLYNRRYLKKELQLYIELAKDQKHALSIILFDIDFFKNINDTYGHPIGDEVLRSLSGILLAETRSHDIISRYGGEEFLLVLFDTRIDVAQQIADRIRSIVARTKLSLQIPYHITLSGGVSEYTSDMTIEEFIAAADDNLYKAKYAGRNQIVSA